VTADAVAAAIPAAAAAGLRTVPPRETGGNLDVRQLGIGGRILLPVHVPGALLSVGDLHAAQGDGELAGGAIEIAGAVTLRCALHRAPAWASPFPVVAGAPAGARPRLLFTGIPIADDGSARDGDLGLAARNAARAALHWLLAVRGLETGPAIGLLGLACDLRIAQLVNHPHPTVTAALALDVFDPPIGPPSRWCSPLA